jgi:hypothetical protein
VYPPVGRRKKWKSRLTLSMSTVNVEPVAPALSPEKRLSTTTVTDHNGILHRYFYFSMSLLVAAIVVAGFKRTVNNNLFHPAAPGPSFAGFMPQLSPGG